MEQLINSCDRSEGLSVENFCGFWSFSHQPSVLVSPGQKGAKGVAGDPGKGLLGPDGPQGLRGETSFSDHYEHFVSSA